MVRTGRGVEYALSPYHRLLTMPWRSFFALVLAFYLVANTLFALAYFAVGPEQLGGPGFGGIGAPWGAFLRAFFFSVETFATIGYGHVFPQGIAANVIVTVESLVGLVSVALATGLVFARFSRPTAAIRYSRHAVIAPFRGGMAFMFRCANERDNQLIEVSVRVTYSRTVTRNGRRTREFTVLPLEYDRVTFFALSWTVVHPIDAASPLAGCTPEAMLAGDAEFLVLLSGTDDTFSQTVHSRTSYRADEVVWGARFLPMFLEAPGGGITGMDLGRIDAIEPVAPRAR